MHLGLWTPGPGLNHVLDVYSTVLLVFSAIPANLFPIVYSRRPWRTSWIGRALMVKATGLALLIDISLIYFKFGDDYPYRQFVRAFVYTFIITGITLQFIVLCLAPLSRDLSAHKRTRDPEELPHV